MSIFKGNRHDESFMETNMTTNPDSTPAGFSKAKSEDLIATQLSPIPSPGIAVFPNLVSSLAPGQTQTIMMQPNWKTSGFDVTDMRTNQPVMSIVAPNPSLTTFSSKRTFTDSSTGQKLCDFEKKTMSSKYQAKDPASKKSLIEVSVDKGSSKITATVTVLAHDASTGEMSFGNEISDGSGKAKTKSAGSPKLEWKGHASELQGTLRFDGQPVATIEKSFMVTHTEYHLRVVEGLDPFIVIVLAAAIDDKRKQSNKQMAFVGGGTA